MSFWSDLRAKLESLGRPEEVRGSVHDVLAAERAIARLAPLVAADGGAIELVAVEDGWVEVRLRGACASCAASAQTLEEALRPALAAELEGFRGLRRVP